MIVSLNPFKANLDIADVILPMAPFTETSGTFVNAEGRQQSFHAVVKPLGETRPGWKILRVLGNMLGLEGFQYESSQEVLASANRKSLVLDNTTNTPVRLGSSTTLPVTASIYELDGIVRRAPSLQRTADALRAGGQA